MRKKRQVESGKVKNKDEQRPGLEAEAEARRLDGGWNLQNYPASGSEIRAQLKS